MVISNSGCQTVISESFSNICLRQFSVCMILTSQSISRQLPSQINFKLGLSSNLSKVITLRFKSDVRDLNSSGVTVYAFAGDFNWSFVKCFCKFTKFNSQSNLLFFLKELNAKQFYFLLYSISLRALSHLPFKFYSLEFKQLRGKERQRTNLSH